MRPHDDPRLARSAPRISLRRGRSSPSSPPPRWYLTRFNLQMGKILSAGEGLASVRAKVRRGGGGAGCGPELAAYLACLDAKDRDEEACRGVRDALSKCMANAVETNRLHGGRHKLPVNFHLQKFAKAFKR